MNTTQKDTFDPGEGNPFIGQSGSRALDDDVRQRAKAFVDRNPSIQPHNEGLSSKEKRRLTAAVAGVALVSGAAMGVAPSMAEGLRGLDERSIEYSQDTTTYTTLPGDGWLDVVESIEGIDTVDARIVIDDVAGDPANIDVLTTENGGLEPNQRITIPVSINQ